MVWPTCMGIHWAGIHGRASTELASKTQGMQSQSHWTVLASASHADAIICEHPPFSFVLANCLHQRQSTLSPGPPFKIHSSITSSNSLLENTDIRFDRPEQCSHQQARTEQERASWFFQANETSTYSYNLGRTEMQQRPLLLEEATITVNECGTARSNSNMGLLQAKQYVVRTATITLPTLGTTRFNKPPFKRVPKRLNICNTDTRILLRPRPLSSFPCLKQPLVFDHQIQRWTRMQWIKCEC